MIDGLDARQRTTFTLDAGTWTLRRLGLRDQMRAIGRATQILGCPFDDAPAGFQVAAMMLATVEIATVDGPLGWDWNSQEDDRVLSELYDQYLAWDATFRGGVAPAPGAVGGGSGA